MKKIQWHVQVKYYDKRARKIVNVHQHLHGTNQELLKRYIEKNAQLQLWICPMDKLNYLTNMDKCFTRKTSYCVLEVFF